MIYFNVNNNFKRRTMPHKQANSDGFSILHNMNKQKRTDEARDKRPKTLRKRRQSMIETFTVNQKKNCDSVNLLED